MAKSASRTSSRSAPRRPLTRDRIFRSALKLVDRVGLEGLSMRELGRALGVEAMSLYHHVPNKAALLDGLHDLLIAEVDLEDGGGGWEDDLRRAGRSYWRMLVAHPNAVPLLLASPSFTPGARVAAEAALRILHRAGLAPSEAYRMFRLLQALFAGVAMMVTTRPSARALRAGVRGLAGEGSEFPLLSAALSDPESLDPEQDFLLAVEILIQAIRVRSVPPFVGDEDHQ